MLKTNLLFDGRNLYNPERLEAHGLTCIGVGRSSQGAGAPAKPPASTRRERRSKV